MHAITSNMALSHMSLYTGFRCTKDQLFKALKLRSQCLGLRLEKDKKKSAKRRVCGKAIISWRHDRLVYFSIGNPWWLNAVRSRDQALAEVRLVQSDQGSECTAIWSLAVRSLDNE